MPTLRAEFRKLLTVRSTYVSSALSLAVASGLAFYLAGWHATPNHLRGHTFLAAQAASPLAIVAVLGTVVAVLVITHEYRYNLLLHTLTAANNRNKVLAAKVTVVTGFAVALTLAVDVVSLVFSYLGARIVHGQALAPQTVRYGDLLWRTLFYGWGYAIAGLVIALLIRNQVGTMVTAFLLFGPIEGFLGVALGKSAYFLPFTALGNVLGSKLANTVLVPVSHERAALAFGADLAIAASIAWLGFLRRDASA
jgi:ABC-2 type transport system permease protein